MCCSKMHKICLILEEILKKSMQTCLHAVLQEPFRDLHLTIYITDRMHISAKFGMILFLGLYYILL